MTEMGFSLAHQLTLPMDEGELDGALQDIADMEGVAAADIVMSDYELHGRFSEYSLHDFDMGESIADMNRFAQVVVNNPELSVGELFYYNDDHEIYDIDAIIGSAEKMIALQGAPDGDLCLDDLAEAKGDEAEMVNEGIGTIGAGTLEGGDR